LLFIRHIASDESIDRRTQSFASAAIMKRVKKSKKQQQQKYIKMKLNVSKASSFQKYTKSDTSYFLYDDNYYN